MSSASDKLFDVICAAIADDSSSRGYYGFCIHTSLVHGDRVRNLYAASKEERDEWMSVLRRACRSVPFEEVRLLDVAGA
jgi:hypothetical protein